MSRKYKITSKGITKARKEGAGVRKWLTGKLLRPVRETLLIPMAKSPSKLWTANEAYMAGIGYMRSRGMDIRRGDLISLKEQEGYMGYLRNKGYLREV